MSWGPHNLVWENHSGLPNPEEMTSSLRFEALTRVPGEAGSGRTLQRVGASQLGGEMKVIQHDQDMGNEVSGGDR